MSKELNFIKNKFLIHVSFIERIADDIVQSVINREKDKLEKILQKEKKYLESSFCLLDDLCVSAIACYRPVSAGLRTVFGIVRINDRLRLISHQFLEMAANGFFFCERPPIHFPREVVYMMEHSLKYLCASMNYYIQQSRPVYYDQLIKGKEYFAGLMKTIMDKVFVSGGMDEDMKLHLFRLAAMCENILNISLEICREVGILRDISKKEKSPLPLDKDEGYREACLKLENIEKALLAGRSSISEELSEV